MDRSTLAQRELALLTTLEFEASLPATSNGVALRAALMGHADVASVDRLLSAGVITDTDCREFASAITARFERGTMLPHAIALAALAVLLEERHSGFAREYVESLAALRHPELREARCVAQACLASRNAETQTEARQFGIAADCEVRDWAVNAGVREWVSNVG